MPVTLGAECQRGPLLAAGQATPEHIFLWVTTPPSPQETIPLHAHPTTQTPPLPIGELHLLPPHPVLSSSSFQAPGGYLTQVISLHLLRRHHHPHFRAEGLRPPRQSDSEAHSA